MKAFLALFFSLITVSATAGPVTGRIVDSNQKPVPSALVFVTSPGRATQSTLADNDGRFTIATPDDGQHEVRVAVPGFRANGVRVTGARDEQNVGDVRLDVSPISESIVVSAAQVEVPLSQAVATVTVISGAELQSRQLHSVADALRTVPGLSVVSSGSTGAVTGVFPRGGESNFTLVFVDDVPVNAFGGEFDFAHLSTANVERIEVVRGPQSALFGANAIGGVVRIITRRGGAPTLSGSIEAGGYDTQRYTGVTSGSSGAFEWGAAVERLSSDGFNGHTTASGLTVSNDDYERTSGGFSAGWRTGETRLRADVRMATDDRGAPGPFGTNPIGAFTEIDDVSRTSNDHASFSALAAFPMGARVRALVVGAFNRLESDFVSPFGPSEAGSRRWSGRAQADFTASTDLAFSAGLELQRERATSTFITGAEFQPVPIRRWVTGYFAEGRWTRERVVVNGGLRLEDIRRDELEESPDAFSPRPLLPSDTVLSWNPRLAVSWLVRPDAATRTRVRASAGTGIRPPSGFDLAFTNNPSLKPERSFSAEAGVEQSFAGGRAVFDAVAFLNDYDDLIVAVGSFNESSHYTTDNISNARAQGIEVGLGVRHRFDGSRPIDLHARVAYTWLHTEVLAVDRDDAAPPPFTVGDPLLRQPRHQFSTNVSLDSGRLSAFLTGGGRDQTLDVEPTLGTFGGLFENPGFNAWSAGVSWRLGPADLFGRVENLFDRDYEEALGFPVLGRRATVGLRVATSR